MDLNKLLCSLIGHKTVNRRVDGFVAGWSCVRCHEFSNGLPIPSAPPLKESKKPEAIKLAIQLDGIEETKQQVAEVHQMLQAAIAMRDDLLASPAVNPPAKHGARLSDRIKIDDIKDVVTIDGHPFDGAALSWLTTVSPDGQWFRITNAPKDGAIVITSRCDEPAGGWESADADGDNVLHNFLCDEMRRKLLGADWCKGGDQRSPAVFCGASDAAKAGMSEQKQ